jgi:hypothetical protein
MRTFRIPSLSKSVSRDVEDAVRRAIEPLRRKSPMVAGMDITAADPGGLWGFLKESFAGGAALTKAAADPNANALVKTVVADFSTSDGRTAARDGFKAEFADAKPVDIKAKSLETLCEVSALLTAKGPADAAVFKDWLRQISQSTGKAATEGGGLSAAAFR